MQKSVIFVNKNLKIICERQNNIEKFDTIVVIQDNVKVLWIAYVT